eukprot:15473764-Alexandrium_andersonii.AAC.1
MSTPCWVQFANMRLYGVEEGSRGGTLSSFLLDVPVSAAPPEPAKLEVFGPVGEQDHRVGHVPLKFTAFGWKIDAPRARGPP